MTPDELIELLKVSKSTLNRLKVPYVLVGSSRRYDYQEVIDYLRSLLKESRTDG